MKRNVINHIGSIAILLCLFISTVSCAEESVSIRGLRYDYSHSLYWGFFSAWDNEDLDATFQKFQDMPQVELQDMYDHPEDWGKGWIQFNVSPS